MVEHCETEQKKWMYIGVARRFIYCEPLMEDRNGS